MHVCIHTRTCVGNSVEKKKKNDERDLYEQGSVPGRLECLGVVSRGSTKINDTWSHSSHQGTAIRGCAKGKSEADASRERLTEMPKRNAFRSGEEGSQDKQEKPTENRDRIFLETRAHTYTHTHTNTLTQFHSHTLIPSLTLTLTH